MKFSTWWVSAWLWLALATGAAAQTKKVVVLRFDGKAAGQVRNHVLASLKRRSEVELMSFRDAEAAASRLGQSLDSPSAFVAVGRELGVDAFVEGDVRRRRGRWVAKVRVRDASTGEVTGEEPWARKSVKRLRAIRGNFWPILGTAITGSSAPQPAAAEPEPAPELEPEPEPAPEPEPPPALAEQEDEHELEDGAASQSDPRESSGRPALKVDVLPGLMWRKLEYNEATADLRGYHNSFDNPAFLLGLETEWYPGAHVSTSRWADLGLEVGFDYALGLESNDPTTGNNVGTTAWDLLAGAIFRIPIKEFTPKLKVGYVRQVFDVDVDPDAVFLPNFDYSALRFGAGFAVLVGEVVELEAGLAYLLVLDGGEINGDRYFPRGNAGGIDLDSSITFYLKEWVGLMLGIDWRRYGHDFKVDPTFMQTGGPKVAGGATDRYLKLDFGVRFQL